MRSFAPSTELGLSLVVLLASFAFYLAGASPSIAPRDSADMAAAAYTLGVAHPPGYPLYSILGRAWMSALPIGDEAYRLAVLSCLAASFSVFAVFVSTRRRLGTWPAFASSLVLLLSAPLWKFALIQEKYALHAMFVSLLLLSSDDVRHIRLSAFIFGIGLVNHQSLLFWAPTFLWLWSQRLRSFKAAVSEMWPWVAVGLTPYLFVFVRLHSFSDALKVILRTQYGSGTLSSSLAGPLGLRLPSLLPWSLKAMAEAVSWPCFAAAVFGAWRSRGPRTSALVLGALLCGPLFAVLSAFDPSSWVARSVLEPAWLVPAITAAVLCGEAVAAAGAAAPAAALALGVCAFSLRASPVPERRDDFLAHDYAANLRRAVPPGGALLAGGDTALFGLRWLDVTRPGSSREVAGAGLVDARAWLAAHPDSSASGLPPEAFAGRPVLPDGLVVRLGAGAALRAPVVLRRSASWERNESYARDARLSYAFASWSAARLVEKSGKPAPVELDLRAVALDPDDYSLE